MTKDLKSASALSRSTETDLGSDASLRRARTTTTAGRYADFSAFNVNGETGSLLPLANNLFVKLDASVDTRFIIIMLLQALLLTKQAIIGGTYSWI